LVHFFWRFGWAVFWRGDRESAGFGASLGLDAIALVMLPLPNLTSFLFSGVPIVKPKGSEGDTIWQEYRLHAALFACRSWVMLMLLCYQRHFGNLSYLPLYRACIVTLTMLAAKAATQRFPAQVSTVRGFYPEAKWASNAAGFAQYLGTAGTLIGTEYDIGLHWLAITVIQFNAFFMTLRKKRIVGPTFVSVAYSLLLLSVTYMFLLTSMLKHPPVSGWDGRLHFVYLAATAFQLRRTGFSRFSAWGVAMAVGASLTAPVGVRLGMDWVVWT